MPKGKKGFQKGHKINVGRKHSQKAKEKMSKSMSAVLKKKWEDPEYRKKMSEAHKGKTHAGSFKKGHEQTNTGRTHFKKGQNTGEDNYFYGKRFIGEKHPQWKGGTYNTFRKRVMGLKEYKQWRTAVFQRDDYTCQECGDRNKKGKRVVIHADHIKPYKDIVKENDIKTIEDVYACEELWDISNGRTLCVDCHRKTPTYGIKTEKIYG